MTTGRDTLSQYARRARMIAMPRRRGVDRLSRPNGTATCTRPHASGIPTGPLVILLDTIADICHSSVRSALSVSHRAEEDFSVRELVYYVFTYVGLLGRSESLEHKFIHNRHAEQAV